MIDQRPPKFQWGQRVAAQIDLVNDGSHPEAELDAILVTQGMVGEIVQIGHHVEANLPVYIVDFEGTVVGCLEEEIALAMAERVGAAASA